MSVIFTDATSPVWVEIEDDIDDIDDIDIDKTELDKLRAEAASVFLALQEKSKAAGLLSAVMPQRE